MKEYLLGGQRAFDEDSAKNGSKYDNDQADCETIGDSDNYHLYYE